MTNSSLRKPPPWHQGCLFSAAILAILVMISVVVGLRFAMLIAEQRGVSMLGSKVALAEKSTKPSWLDQWVHPRISAVFRPTVALSAARDLSDEDLKSIGKLTHLEFLDLTHTAITDSGLAHLKRLRSLRKIDVSHTQVSDAGLAHLKALPKLDLLDVRGTKVSRGAVGKLKRERTDLKVLGP